MNRLSFGLASMLALIAIGAYLLLRPAPLQMPLSPSTPVVSPPSPSAITPAPPISHPVLVPPGMTELPPLAQADDFVKERITELLGNEALNYLQIDNFVRRVVATVDNLPHSLAPTRMWPIHPTPGRFAVEDVADGHVISTKNVARYAPFMSLVESVDIRRVVALYRRLYPLFQSAYEELGYPGKYFNDRLVEVIDLLLETPVPPGPPKVELPEVEGPLKPTRPWLLYRYSDPALETLSGGQKILLRVGPENEKRLKAKLAEIRKLISVEKLAR